MIYATPVLFLIWGAVWIAAWARVLARHAIREDQPSPYWPLLRLLDSSRYDQEGRQLLRVLRWSTVGLVVAYYFVAWWLLNLLAN